MTLSSRGILILNEVRLSFHRISHSYKPSPNIRQSKGRCGSASESRFRIFYDLLAPLVQNLPNA